MTGPHTRTLPSEHAMRCLRRAASDPFPVQEVNHTVFDKLHAWGYATIEARPSPYKTHKPGRKVNFMICTDQGRQAIRETAS